MQIATLIKHYKQFFTARKEDVFIAVVLLGLLILTSWPLLNSDLFRVHDYVHAARIVELVDAASAGHFPVRWTANFGFGYGMPLYIFYAPLPFYVAGVFYWLTNNVLVATKLLFLLPNLAAIIGSYLLGKQLYGKKAGLLVSMAYSLAPYRAVNLYVRGAVGESWGMAAMPLVLWAGIWFISQAKPQLSKAWWQIVFWLVVLILSHNLSTLMFVPISVVVLGVFLLQKYGWSKKAFQAVLYFAGAYGLATGLTAFYTIPAILEKDFTIIDSILSGYFHYSHHFLYIRQFFVDNWGYGGSAWGPDDGISFFLGYGQLISLLVVAVGAALTGWKKINKQQLLLALVFAFFLGVSLFLTVLKSQPIWDTVPLIDFIQFPWRWLSVAIVFLAMLAGYGFSLLPTQRVKQIAGVLLAVVLLLNSRYFQPESFLERSEDFYYTDRALIRKQMSEILPDYIPNDMKLASLIKDDQAAENDETGNTQELLPVNLDADVLYNVEAQELETWSIQVNQPQEKLITVSKVSDEPLTFAIAQFPGWKAEVDGVTAETFTTKSGLLQVAVPSGTHQVAVWFGSTPTRQLSDAISLASSLLTLGLLTPAAFSRKAKS